jgi:hypothetical protein
MCGNEPTEPWRAVTLDRCGGGGVKVDCGVSRSTRLAAE